MKRKLESGFTDRIPRNVPSDAGQRKVQGTHGGQRGFRKGNRGILKGGNRGRKFPSVGRTKPVQ